MVSLQETAMIAVVIVVLFIAYPYFTRGRDE